MTAWEAVECLGGDGCGRHTQFTSFSGTKVQILTQLRRGLRAEADLERTEAKRARLEEEEEKLEAERARLRHVKATS